MKVRGRKLTKVIDKFVKKDRERERERERFGDCSFVLQAFRF